MAYLGRPGATAPLTTADIPDNSITAAKIVADTIAAGDIATGAVGTAEIADDAVTGAKLANDIAITTTGALTGTTGDFNWDSNTLVVDSSASKVGVGTASPSNPLHVEASLDGDFATLIHNTDADNGQGLMIRAGADSGEAILSLRNQASSTKMIVRADGNVGINEATPTKQMHITHASWANMALEGSDTGGSYIDFMAGSSEFRGRILMDNESATTTDGKMQFFTGGNDSSARMTITSSGNVQMFGADSTLSIGRDNGYQINLRNTANSDGSAINWTSNNLSFHNGGGSGNKIIAYPMYQFEVWTRNGWSAGYLERLRVTHTHVDADQTFRDNQFDFAEYFEWEDGNPNEEYRAGESVVLVGNKIRIATASDAEDTILGVISETGAFVGNAGIFEWNDRYMKDDFGKYLMEDNNIVMWFEGEEGPLEDKIEHVYNIDEIPVDVTVPERAEYLTEQIKIENPDYDETLEYIPRDARKEWTVVGLLGQVAIKKSSPKKSNWIKMSTVSDTVERYLIR